MPRYPRIVVPDCPHHLTQRGNHRQNVFDSPGDREIYLDLVRRNALDCDMRLLGYSLMSNHVHWIVIPSSAKSLAAAFGRAHCRYSNYFQTKRSVSGHLWQNRFYSCPLSYRHLGLAMAYVEQNPVRAGLVQHPEDYPWSSARAHLWGVDPQEIVDATWWGELHPPAQWRGRLQEGSTKEENRFVERCTFAGKPCGDNDFLAVVAHYSSTDLILRRPGRPKTNARQTRQIKLANC
jgi:putative transposase